MVEIDSIIDIKPTADQVRMLAELRNRNILCLRELQLFNASGKWKNKHPLLKQYSLRSKLKELKSAKPDQFLQDFARADYNINRYKSYLNRKNAKPEDREKWQAQLKKHQERCEVFKEVMKDE